MGESGSGKSTLGKAILNVLNLTAPDVRISGQVNLYEDNILNWEFYIRSFLGGNDYKNGYNLLTT